MLLFLFLRHCNEISEVGKKVREEGFIPAHDLVYSHLSPGLLGRCVVKQDKVAESTQWNDGVYSTMARKLAGRRPVVLSKA